VKSYRKLAEVGGEVGVGKGRGEGRIGGDGGGLGGGVVEEGVAHDIISAVGQVKKVLHEEISPLHFFFLVYFSSSRLQFLSTLR